MERITVVEGRSTLSKQLKPRDLLLGIMKKYIEMFGGMRCRHAGATKNQASSRKAVNAPRRLKKKQGGAKKKMSKKVRASRWCASVRKILNTKRKAEASTTSAGKRIKLCDGTFHEVGSAPPAAETIPEKYREGVVAHLRKKIGERKFIVREAIRDIKLLIPMAPVRVPKVQILKSVIKDAQQSPKKRQKVTRSAQQIGFQAAQKKANKDKRKEAEGQNMAKEKKNPQTTYWLDKKANIRGLPALHLV